MFTTDKAMQQIKVDGFVEQISSDMHLISQLHEGLDTIPLSKDNSSNSNTNGTTNHKDKPGMKKQVSTKQDELISNNKGVWDTWWSQKLKSNQQLVSNAKKGNYEEVAKLIDPNFNDDLGAAINYQEPGTGYTALHYAAKSGNNQLLNLLIQNNADVMVQDCKGMTATHLAC